VSGRTLIVLHLIYQYVGLIFLIFLVERFGNNDDDDDNIGDVVAAACAATAAAQQSTQTTIYR
jgi:hypothetical protein